MENQPVFEFGARVRVKDLPGEWVVKMINSDGSICVYGGPVYRKAFRNFPVERIIAKDRK